MIQRRRRARSLAATFACVALAALATGCQQYWRDTGVWDIGEHRGLLLDISNYYHRHASEEGGYCRSPIMDGVTRADIIEENDEKVWVTLSYRYRDFINDGDDCDWKWRPLRCTIHRQCRGYAHRTFEAVKREAGYEVTEMAGPRRR